MNEKEIQGIICFIVFFLLLIVFAIRHIISERKKHGKYFTRIRLAKWAIHSALFIFTFLLLYLFRGFSSWLSIFILIFYLSAFWIISDKFNDD